MSTEKIGIDFTSAVCRNKRPPILVPEISDPEDFEIYAHTNGLDLSSAHSLLTAELILTAEAKGSIPTQCIPQA